MLTLHSIQVMVNIGIALSEVASSAFLQPRDLDRLRAVATLVPLGVLQAGNLPAALADVDILLSSWGQIPLDAAFLAAAPRLRLVAYTAGSPRGLQSRRHHHHRDAWQCSGGGRRHVGINHPRV